MNDTIGAIYSSALHSSLVSFKEEALRTLRAVVPFDSAVWGSGIYSSNTMLSLTLLDQPIDMLIEYAARWQDSDYCRSAAVASPGRAFCNASVQPLDSYRASPIYREFSKPWGIEDALTIVQLKDGLDLAEIVCLFRRDEAATFTGAEAAKLEQLAPHLARAWAHAQIAHHYRASGKDGPIAAGDAQSYAVAGHDRLLRTAGDTFLLRAQRIASGWIGPALPDALQTLITGRTECMRVADFEFHAHPADDAILIFTRTAHKRVRVTPAEQRVARLYVSGLRRKEIAAQLGVSPATVRNQIASVFDKFGCKTKLGLLYAMRKSDEQYYGIDH